MKPWQRWLVLNWPPLVIICVVGALFTALWWAQEVKNRDRRALCSHELYHVTPTESLQVFRLLPACMK